MKTTTTLILSLLFAFTGIAQTTIKGCVTDAETGKGIPNVNIIMLEDSRGTITNSDGCFEFHWEKGGEYTLKASYVGYEVMTKKIHFEGKSLEVNFSLLRLTTELDEVSVTASRYKRKMIEVPASVSSISPEEITLLSSSNTDNLLQAIPNVYVNRSWGIFSKNSSVTMRGMDGTSRVLVLYNGVPLNKTAGGGINWHIVNPDQIERIEVIRGPASALYGNNAMAGVINIITKTPSKKFGGSISTSYGTFNTMGSRLNLQSNQIENGSGWYANVEAFYRQGDGYIKEPFETRDSNDVALYLKEASANAKFGYQFKPGTKLELEYQFYSDKRGDGIEVYEDGGGYLQYPTHYLRTKYETTIKDIKLSGHMFYHKQDYLQFSEKLNQTGDTYKMYNRENNTRDYGIWISGEKNWNSNHTLIFGIDAKNGTIDASEVYLTSSDELYMKGAMKFAAAFTQYEFNKGNWNIQGGLRFDYASYYNGSLEVVNPTSITAFEAPKYEDFPTTNWTNISPRVAIMYNFNKKNKIYASVGKGFMPPKLDDMSSSRKISSGFKVANPHLTPEKMISYEIGTHLRPFKDFSLDWAAYINDGYDFMYFVATGDTVDFDRTVYQRQNISRVQIIGSEISVAFKLLKNLQLTANYSYNHSIIKEFNVNGEQDLEGKLISETPPHQFYIGAMYKHKYFTGSLSYNNISSMYADEENELLLEPYATLDLRLSLNVLDPFIITLDVQNMLDKIYVDKKGGLAPGRFIIGRITYNF
jgi:iron complex outermembrane receptor protein